MSISTIGWKNKAGTGKRSCACGSWKDHWIKFSGKDWPRTCSVKDCNKQPTLGAHVYHSDVTGERIIPMCNSCNGLDEKFDLKCGVTRVKANQAETCDNPSK